MARWSFCSVLAMRCLQLLKPGRAVPNNDGSQEQLKMWLIFDFRKRPSYFYRACVGKKALHCEWGCPSRILDSVQAYLMVWTVFILFTAVDGLVLVPFTLNFFITGLCQPVCETTFFEVHLHKDSCTKHYETPEKNAPSFLTFSALTEFGCYSYKRYWGIMWLKISH